MRPAARLRTIADLLPVLLADQRPADRILQDWARANRYAGSKDRRDLADRLFAILRHYSRLTDVLGSDAPLLIAMLAAHRLDGLPLDEVLALADGSPHAAAPLSAADEKTLRHAAAAAPSSRAARLAVPDWLLADADAQLGAAADAVLEAMLARAPVDVRVNSLKTDRDKAQKALAQEGFAAAPHDSVETALRLHGAPRLQNAKAFTRGLIEVQDAGAQAVTALCGAKRFDTVMDFCAGAGGKALALAAQMQNKGRLLVHDAIAPRMADLPQRATRAGIGIIETVAPEKLGDFAGHCDLVVADVPCSGAGRWRRAPETKWRLTPAALQDLCRLQAEILDAAAALVKPGGRLAYITCSLLASENSRQVSAFLERNQAFEADAAALPQGQDGELQLHPANADTDGLYLALLRRADDPAGT